MRFKALLLTAGLTAFPLAHLHAQEPSAIPASPQPQAFASLPTLAFATAETLPPIPAPLAIDTSAAGIAVHPIGFFTDTEPSLRKDRKSSTYIPVDSWIYPEMTRLYSMGFVSTTFIGMRPWTRRSLLHILQASQDQIMGSNNEEAQEILAKLLDELTAEVPSNSVPRGTVYGLDSVYTRITGIAGTPLRDSFHLGQTLMNDYGRPYQGGFNNYTGFSTIAERGRFSLYVRGEYQHSPSAPGYSLSLAQQLSDLDIGGTGTFVAPNRPQATIPFGPLPAQNPFRLLEATLSMHLWGHEISGGKTDAWLGPAMGGAMGWSNNAENIYSFRINRIEPLRIPLISRVLGPLRYDFFYGSLKGHTDPNSPYVHMEMFEFHPSKNFELGFQRTVIFGGEGHEPVTLHTFLRSFINLGDTEADPQDKFSPQDPGARFSDFNFSWRLPFLRKYATLYVDSIAHDDISPPSAPRRAAYRPGIEISQFPGLRKLEFRFEGISTDPPVTRSMAGQFNYFEAVQRQGYTNKGFIMGDWIGREGKGGQTWLTYHLSGNEWIQLEVMHKKNAHDFIQYGTTQNQFKLSAVKRFHRDLEVNAWVQVERWIAPIYMQGQQNDTSATVQLTWFPKLHTANPTPAP